MKKKLIVGFLIVALLVVAFLTFVIAAIKIVVGSIFLGIFAPALLGIWITWKTKKD